MARASIYTDDLAEIICSRLGAGEPLDSICRDEAMPGLRTVLRWAGSNEEFAGLYRSAQAAQAEHLDAEIQRINLSQAGANKLMPLAGKFYERIIDGQIKGHAVVKAEWAKQTKNGPDLGGATGMRPTGTSPRPWRLEARRSGLSSGNCSTRADLGIFPR